MLRLNSSQKQTLLRIARRSVESRLRPGAEHDAPDSNLREKRGVFVSIYNGGRLRGCIGRVHGDAPLPQATAECAVSAAFDDPRFVPISLDELPEATFEISVLSHLARVDDVENVEIGRHGLLVEQHGRRGLLLPQVAVACGWDREEFLRRTSIKAGLDPEAWRAGAHVWVFEAVVFGEGES